MASLKKILEAARLIESTEPAAREVASTDDAELDAIIQRAAAASPPPHEVEPASVAPATTETPQGIEEGLAFADIFARQGVAAAQFPIERLLKLVEGLRTLDPATRRAAVMAMDVADETWSMEQVLGDADAKVAALRAHQRELQTTADSVVQSNKARILELERSRDSTVAELRQQIAALEAQIQDALGAAAAEVAKLQSQSESNKAALSRETQRIDAHILNIDELAAQFRPPAK
ncbi:MAG: hypothetical protein E6Q88_10035 [Lysobacteraceae bacterium]|nr:MAG: hypothetical protein E6Q88_10035 [Xanthomonadaceae bacterium]